MKDEILEQYRWAVGALNSTNPEERRLANAIFTLVYVPDMSEEQREAVAVIMTRLGALQTALKSLLDDEPNGK